MPFIAMQTYKELMMQTLFANQMYNYIKIRTSILEQITVPSSSVQTFAFAAVCEHLPSPEYIHQILETLFLHPKNKWLTLKAIQEVSHRANFGFMNDEVVYCNCLTFRYSNETKRKCFPHITSQQIASK